jgi:hypothetical protein
MEHNHIFNMDQFEGNELIIRHGEALPEREPNPVDIKGTLPTVREYLAKRDVDFKDSVLYVNKETGFLELTLNETSPYRGSVVGQVFTDPHIHEWHINDDSVSWTTQGLATFMKKHIHHFFDKNEGRKLISDLMQFEGKVEKEIQDQNDQKGNVKFKYAQAIEHNLPKSFWLSIPLFKGQEKQKFEVEIIVDPKDYSCSLISNELYEMADGYIEARVNDEVSRILDTYPSLPIVFV